MPLLTKPACNFRNAETSWDFCVKCIESLVDNFAENRTKSVARSILPCKLQCKMRNRLKVCG